MNERPQVLIVDDEPDVASLLIAILEPLELDIRTAESGEEALGLFQPGEFALVMTDLNMPGIDGRELMRRVLKRDPAVQIVIMTGDAQKTTLDMACETIREGAFHFFAKPFRNPRQIQVFVELALRHRGLVRENLSMRAELRSYHGLENMVGKSQAMERFKTMLRRVADSDSTVLITGESGVGKELAAQAIHGLSPRAKRTLVKINCHTLADSMLESELFGHTKGAFTGATAERSGLFAAADGGTILLDEIGGVTERLQSKLLRVLETGEVRKVGSDEVRVVDVRVLASTNRSLSEAVKDGLFREDLFYRLNVLELSTPPLRERLEDISALATHFLEKLSHDREAPQFEPGFVEMLMQYDWPGNVRQLRSALERAYLLREANTLYRRHLPPEILSPERMRKAAPGEASERAIPETPLLPLSLEDGEKMQIEKALTTTSGHLTKAAELLGISRRTLYTKVRRYGLDPKAIGRRMRASSV